MKDLLEFIVKSIVSSPEKVVISQEEGEVAKFIVEVPQDQVGIILGQQGRTIKAIKSLMSVIAKGNRFTIEVVETKD